MFGVPGDRRSRVSGPAFRRRDEGHAAGSEAVPAEDGFLEGPWIIAERVDDNEVERRGVPGGLARQLVEAGAVAGAVVVAISDIETVGIAELFAMSLLGRGEVASAAVFMAGWETDGRAGAQSGGNTKRPALGTGGPMRPTYRKHPPAAICSRRCSSCFPFSGGYWLGFISPSLYALASGLSRVPPERQTPIGMPPMLICLPHSRPRGWEYPYRAAYGPP